MEFEDVKKNFLKLKECNIIFCEQCKHCGLEVHDPMRTGEPPRDPTLVCIIDDRYSKVHAWGFCDKAELDANKKFRVY